MDVRLFREPNQTKAAKKATIETTHTHQGIGLPIKLRTRALTGGNKAKVAPNRAIPWSQFPSRNIEIANRPKMVPNNQLKMRAT